VKPDYAKAFEFYQKALDVGLKPERRIEVELARGAMSAEYGELARGDRTLREVH